MKQFLFSEKYYDEIWTPYFAYIQHFIRSNPSGLTSFLKLMYELHRYTFVLGGPSIRAAPDLGQVDWQRTFTSFEEKRVYLSKRLDDKRFWCAETGWEDFWTSFCLSVVLGHDRRAPRAYVDLGCGIGKFLFSIFARTLDTDIRLHGIDYSRVGLDCARAVFSLLKNSEIRPFTNLVVGDLTNPRPDAFDCGGLDVVVLSVSALNKVSLLPPNYYGLIRQSLVNHGKVELVHIESVGWQAYFDRELASFYSGVKHHVHEFTIEDRPRFEAQRSKNMNAESNSNLMELIATAHQNGDLNILNIFMNAFTPNPVDPYTLFHLELL